jgi:cytochrome P450 family 12
LRQEILSLLPEKNSRLTVESMKNLPYLRAVRKESFRQFPVAAGNARQLQNDAVLSGYLVPKHTQVAIASSIELNNPQYYPEADRFLPERWLRETNDTGCPNKAKIHPFSYIPFGFGSRSCIGKRIAELEIETLIMNVIRNFKLEWHYPDMKTKSTFVNLPDSEMKFKVIDV